MSDYKGDDDYAPRLPGSSPYQFSSIDEFTEDNDDDDDDDDDNDDGPRKGPYVRKSGPNVNRILQNSKYNPGYGRDGEKFNETKFDFPQHRQFFDTSTPLPGGWRENPEEGYFEVEGIESISPDSTKLSSRMKGFWDPDDDLDQLDDWLEASISQLGQGVDSHKISLYLDDIDAKEEVQRQAGVQKVLQEGAEDFIKKAPLMKNRCDGIKHQLETCLRAFRHTVNCTIPRDNFSRCQNDIVTSDGYITEEKIKQLKKEQEKGHEYLKQKKREQQFNQQRQLEWQVRPKSKHFGEYGEHYDDEEDKDPISNFFQQNPNFHASIPLNPSYLPNDVDFFEDEKPSLLSYQIVLPGEKKKSKRPSQNTATQKPLRFRHKLHLARYFCRHCLKYNSTPQETLRNDDIYYDYHGELHNNITYKPYKRPGYNPNPDPTNTLMRSSQRYKIATQDRLRQYHQSTGIGPTFDKNSPAAVFSPDSYFKAMNQRRAALKADQQRRLHSGEDIYEDEEPQFVETEP